MSARAPVALFAFNRPQHLQQTLKALKENTLAAETEIFIFCDGPKSAKDKEAVAQVQKVIGETSGFRKINIVENPKNLGLANSIIRGVTNVLSTHDRLIVLEDDMITSPQFLTYMNTALDQYKDNQRVGSVHAYMYPLKGLPEYFFMRGGDCWGWGTWADRWKYFEADGKILLRRLKQSKLLSEFNRTGGNQMVRMLLDQIRGRNSSWFIRWHASLFLENKLTLQPGESFLQNIGVDSSGTHCEVTEIFDVPYRPDFKGLPQMEVVPNLEALEKIRKFFADHPGRVWYKEWAHNILDALYLRKILTYG